MVRVVSTKDGVKVAGQDVCRGKKEQEVGELSTWRTPEPALEVNDFDQIGVFPRRKEPTGSTLGDYVVLGVYIWTQPSYFC